MQREKQKMLLAMVFALASLARAGGCSRRRDNLQEDGDWRPL